MHKAIKSSEPPRVGLTGRFTTDYDIPGAHAQVLEHLASDHIRLASYTASASEYLEWYERMRVSKTIRFGQIEVPDDPYAPHRVQLIRRYLAVARKYIPENVVYEPQKQTACGCGTDLAEMLNDLNGVVVCPTCGVERARIGRKKTAMTGSEDIPARRRQDNEERDTFVKALIRFQGMQKDRLPVDLLPRLDAYFRSTNYPTGEEVRNGAVEVRNFVLNKDVMYKALAAVGCPMYEHINLICHKVWGWPLPELHSIYDTVLQHFDILQRVAQAKSIPTINTQYRLFKHLEMAGYTCYAVDFRIPKTREIIQTDEERWRTMCEGVEPYEAALGIRFIPTI
jgi:Poxvirus Late Transcription Factor VLTF3 like